MDGKFNELVLSLLFWRVVQSLMVFFLNLIRNALWYDTLYVEVDSKEMNDEVGLLVNLVEYRNKKILAKFIIPTMKLVPGEQYNICLVLNQEGTCLLFSVMMESFFSFNDFIFTKFADMSRLEVFLSGVVKATKQSGAAPMTPKESVLAADPFDSAPVMAVLHIEQDIDAYLRKIKKVSAIDRHLFRCNETDTLRKRKPRNFLFRGYFSRTQMRSKRSPRRTTKCRRLVCRLFSHNGIRSSSTSVKR